jgi:peptide/nickel transport system substrate-binding protein
MKKRFRSPAKLIFIVTLILAMLPLAVQAQDKPGQDTIVIAINADPATLEPGQVSTRIGANILSHLFVQFYEVGQADGSLVPYLVKDYTTSADGKETTFTINEGVKCEDGSEMTAEDVAYTFQRTADPKNGFSGNANFDLEATGYVSAKAVDKYKVTLTFKAAQDDKLRRGLLSEMYMHCKAPYEKMSLEEASQTPVGNGPYRLKEWVKDDHVTLERNDDFTLRKSNFKYIVWKIIPEASTRAAELIAGNVDIISNVTPEQTQPINDSGVASVQTVNGTNRVYVGFSMVPGQPFSDTPGGKAILDPKVRVALQYAVDVPTICQTLLGAECERMTGMVNKPNDNPDLKPYPYDPAKAEELLDAAGYPKDADGVRFELSLKARKVSGPVGGDVAQAIAQYLTDVGVKTEVDFMENATFIDQVTNHKLGPIFLLSTGGSVWSAQYDMADYPSPTATTNYVEYSNPEYFKLWDALPTAKSADEARQMELKMEEIFYNDPPWLMLYQAPERWGISNRLDFTVRPDGQTIVYATKLK